jgi:hypothetical protein
MSCNCPDTNKCPDTTVSCLCGIYLDIYDDNGVLIETLDSGGYLEPLEGVRFYFLDSTVFPVDPESGGDLYIEYNAPSWGLWYQPDEVTLPYLVTSFTTTSNCPLSSCDWIPAPEVDYIFKTRLIECECCTDGLNLTITHTTYNNGEEFNIFAGVVVDEYGIELIVNQKRYYSFVLNIGGVDYTYYLLFDNTRWILTNSLYLEGNPSYPVYTAYITTSDCPYGFYYPNKPFERFWVRGECFDCCDYDTPKNRNLLKKKKAIFVDEISAIRNKEIFGFNCGPEWDDLFRKHLIFDVLWCLPYGKICDEEQQCLINNLNENCNC